MGKQNHDKHKKSFSKHRDLRTEFVPPRSIRLEEVNEDIIGNMANVKGIIDSVAQTSGPTLFTISDGTGMLVLKGFSSPGARAHPEIGEGDGVNAKVKLNEYNGSFEGEIMGISKMSSSDRDAFSESMQELLRERAKPEEVDFLVESPILEKLKHSFIKAATEIRLAVMQNRPIIIRHHNDADGYASGYALEKAILPLIEKQHGYGKAAWEFFTRAPCAAPFYEIDDSIRDSSHSLSNAAKFSNKMPLVVIADNGSSQEDLFAIKQGKVHGMEFIVVDHHYFEKDVISAEVLVHINPFLVGEDGAQFSAGMLCTELARLISSVENMEQIAAMAGLADRIKNPPVVDEYVRLAKEKGYSKELLIDISAVIDFVSAKLRFMEAREYIEVIFGEPRDKQKSLVHLMAPYIRGLEAKGLKIAKSAADIEKIGKTSVQWLDIENNFPGFGFYPKPGKCVGLAHDDIQETKKLTNVVSIGVLPTALTIRATDGANFSVHDLITSLNKEMPEAFVEGGGHKNAGSITFLPSKQKDIIKLTKEFIKDRQ